MSKEKTNFGNKLVQSFTKGILNIVVPILNHRIIPFRWQAIGGIVTHKKSGSVVLIQCENGYLEVKLVSPSIWRIRASHNTLPKYHKSWASREPDLDLQIKTVQEYGSLTLKEDKNVSSKNDLIVKVSEVDSSVIFERINGDILHQDIEPISMSKRGTWIRTKKAASKKEYHVGFGEKTGKLVKNGRRLIFWNTDQSGYTTRDDPLYQSEPLQISLREDGTAYGIFYDNYRYSVIKLEKTSTSKVNYYTEKGPLCYYIFAGPTLKDVSKQIGELNGKLPLPPRWVLGHHQCRWSYYPEEKVREIARNFREKEIPCDSIHLDIDYMDGFRCFTWNNERFPDPKKMISDLRDDGFKMIIMTDPGLKADPDWSIYQDCIAKDFHCKLPDGKPYLGKVWPGKCIFPDFTNLDVRVWWGKLYKDYIDLGIEGFWIDMAEPSIFDIRRTAPFDVLHDMEGQPETHQYAHNIYGNAFAMATREGLDVLRSNKRTFLFGRTAYSGIQRYASTWTGDNYSTWKQLQQSIPMVLSMGLSGQPFVAVDIGGFSFNCTAELLTRWYQTGIFYPFCRNHSANATQPQEPWVFGEETEKIIKKTIEFRYMLLPYLYTALWEASKDGLPMMRPLFMEFPTDKETYNEKWHNSQFMVGDKLLITPILTKLGKNQKTISKKIYLPIGKWVDYWTQEYLSGGKVITREAKINHLPIFVKAGSVIPLGPIVPYVDKTSEHPITLEIFPDNEIQGLAYFDDGLTKEFEDGNFNLLTIRGNDTSKKLSVDILQSGKITDLPTTNEILQLRIHTNKIPDEIKINDNIAQMDFESDNLYWLLDEAKKYYTIIIKIPKFPMDIQVKYK
ncbi:MAG TPA: TIM-barrel domain-containing protein [Candidatus Bathyarchaeia archaeon]|nr:TIM-barrel domain-containing protein [Candidatus Bathyarchaeia archaeon]